jgi:arabinan endo-1,5-alpha-L-arabinosidase
MAAFAGVEYFAYGTGDRFPVMRSTDLVSWSSAGTAFTSRPSWSSGNSWAPSVLAVGSRCADAPAGSPSTSCYVMYYVGLNNALATPANCIGVATADAPAGPYRDHGILMRASGATDPVRGPIGCGDSSGYSNIDPAPFVDSATGRVYLYLSTGHAASGAWRRTLSVIRMSTDLVHAAAGRVALFSATDTWEKGVVEAPWPHRRLSRYYLFYSGGVFTDASYGMGYRVASSPTGPFVRPAGNPILRSTPAVNGPGGGSVTRGPHGGDWMIYHGRAVAGGPRTLRIDPVVWDGSLVPARASVRGPTTSPQPAP